MVVNIIGVVILAGASLVAVASKLVSWSYGPFGLVVMLANIPYETLVKKLRLTRFRADLYVLIGGIALWSGWTGAWAGIIFALLYATVWAVALYADGQAVRSCPAVQDPRYIGAIPMPHPRIILVVEGPVWSWGRVCDLGDWPCGRKASFNLIVLNPTIIEPQTPMLLSLDVNSHCLDITGLPAHETIMPEPGAFIKFPFSIEAKHLTERPEMISLSLSFGGVRINKQLKVRSVFDPAQFNVGNVIINRWQGGALAGFAWRGDMDMYDPATFQSVKGLRRAFELCRRFRIPSTMFLSGRLSLDKKEHQVFHEHLGVDRKTREIDDFITFMREETTMGGKIDFPYETPTPYAVEVGNHMYLHYGTHAAMAEENGWKNRARMLAGRYAWQSEEEGSMGEQRDNAIKNAQIIEQTLGIKVKTWGVPGRDYDEYTPQAVESSGMEVGSDTNASAFTNVLRLPPPHHPTGCTHLVELTKKYPGDSDNIFKIAMLKYWLWLATVRRSTFIFMAHHHLLAYEGKACEGMTESFFRFVLERGGYYISTLYGLGTYWERVLCPEHRCVHTRMEADQKISITNSGSNPLEKIPVEIHFQRGKHMVLIVDLPAKQELSVSLLQ